MSMTEQNETPAPDKKPKRRVVRRTKAARIIDKAADKPSEFAGMTKSDCASACGAERCVVSDKPYCAHPNKGALHAPQMMDPKSIARLNAAREFLKNT